MNQSPTERSHRLPTPPGSPPPRIASPSTRRTNRSPHAGGSALVGSSRRSGGPSRQQPRQLAGGLVASAHPGGAGQEADGSWSSLEYPFFSVAAGSGPAHGCRRQSENGGITSPTRHPLRYACVDDCWPALTDPNLRPLGNRLNQTSRIADNDARGDLLLVV